MHPKEDQNEKILLILDVDDTVLDGQKAKAHGFSHHGKDLLGSTEDAWTAYNALSRVGTSMQPRELIPLFAALAYHRRWNVDHYADLLFKLQSSANYFAKSRLPDDQHVQDGIKLAKEVKNDLLKDIQGSLFENSNYFVRAKHQARKIFYDIPYEDYVFKGTEKILEAMRKIATVWVFSGGETLLTPEVRARYTLGDLPTEIAGHQEAKLNKVLQNLGFSTWENVHISNNKIKEVEDIIRKAKEHGYTKIVLADDDPKVGKAMLQAIATCYDKDTPVSFLFVRSMQGKNKNLKTDLGERAILHGKNHIHPYVIEKRDLGGIRVEDLFVQKNEFSITRFIKRKQ